MKRLLLTGASGYIGAATIPILLSRGFEIHATTSGALDKCPATDGVQWHSIDLLSENNISKIDRIRATHLLHMAWFAKPGQFWTSNENLAWASASLHLTRTFFSGGGVRAVFAGSCAEYDWNYGYCREFVTPCNPATLYGVCKLSLSKILESYATLNKLSVAWGRIFWLYGRNEHPARLVPSIILSLLNNRTAMCSEGAQLRDFLHVDDVAAAFAALVDSKIDGPMNICSGVPVSVRAVGEHIGMRLNAVDRINFGAIRTSPDEPPLVVGSPRRLQSELGWKQRYTLQSGLDEAIHFWKSTQKMD